MKLFTANDQFTIYDLYFAWNIKIQIFSLNLALSILCRIKLSFIVNEKSFHNKGSVRVTYSNDIAMKM